MGKWSKLEQIWGFIKENYRWWVLYICILGVVSLLADSSELMRCLRQQKLGLVECFRQLNFVYSFTTLLGPLAIYGFEEWRKSKLKKSYKEKFENLEITFKENSLDLHLTLIIKKLNALAAANNQAFGTTERLCIYKHFPRTENEGECFRCVGRRSSNKELAKFTKDNLYPIGNGFISKVYREGNEWLVDRDFLSISPDDRDRILRGEHPGSLEQYRADIKRRHGITRETSKSFRMNAEHMIAKQLKDHNNEEVIGVILFESQRKNFLSLELIKKSCTETDEQLIINMM